MRMLRSGWSDWVVKILVDRVCSVVRLERSRNDGSRILHVLNEVLRLVCMPVLLYRIEIYVWNLHVYLFDYFD